MNQEALNALLMDGHLREEVVETVERALQAREAEFMQAVDGAPTADAASGMLMAAIKDACADKLQHSPWGPGVYERGLAAQVSMLLKERRELKLSLREGCCWERADELSWLS